MIPAPPRSRAQRGLVVLVLLLTTGCGRAAHVRPNAGLKVGALTGSNLLLVTIDTLRSDHVGAYGGTAPTPTLDDLASRGIRFARAYSHAPLTLPAHTSIFTGLVPATHGVHVNGASSLSAGVPTLTELLHARGYRTAAFVGAFVLDARFGLRRGFDEYDDRVGTERGPVTFGFAERSADRVTDAAAGWLLRPDTANAPWFVWVHLFDPHAPYNAPERLVADPYDNEVAFTDRQLGLFLRRLESGGRLAHTLVVLLADHGESLGDHGEATHGLFAYDATLRIPMIMTGTGLEPEVVGAPVAQADLLPTIAELLGIEVPGKLDGGSLLGSIRGEASGDAAIYFEALDANRSRNWAPLTGVVAGDWKYIDLPIPELYDLAHDPGEHVNRASEERVKAAELERRLQPWIKHDAQAPPTALDSGAIARLRALGYVSGEEFAARKTAYGPEDDPKRLIEVDRTYQHALRLTGEGRHEEAIALFRDVLDKRGDFAAAYLTLASVYIEDGRAADAVNLLKDARTRGITGAKVSERLGEAYLAAGNRRQAISTLEPVAGAEDGVDALNALGIAYAELGAVEKARAEFERALGKAPSAASVWNNLGLVELSANRPSAAAAAFEGAVHADPAFAPAWRGLGAARASSDPTAAATAWKHAVTLAPADYDTLFNLIAVLRETGRAGEAQPYIERFIHEAPPERYAADISRLKAIAGK